MAAGAGGRKNLQFWRHFVYEGLELEQQSKYQLFLLLDGSLAFGLFTLWCPKLMKHAKSLSVSTQSA